VVYRVPGTEPGASTLALVPHLDVVPANPTGWSTGSTAVILTMMSGFTDARFRRAEGTIAYGVGLHDDAIGVGGFLSLFHGRDERVSLSSVDLTTELLETVLAGFAADPGV